LRSFRIILRFLSMKARRLPQEDIVLEVVENLQEIIWDKINSGVKLFIKTLIETLLEPGLTEALGAKRSLHDLIYALCELIIRQASFVMLIKSKLANK
jgi:hypothetical protein